MEEEEAKYNKKHKRVQGLKEKAEVAQQEIEAESVANNATLNNTMPQGAPVADNAALNNTMPQGVADNAALNIMPQCASVANTEPPESDKWVKCSLAISRLIDQWGLAGIPSL